MTDFKKDLLCKAAGCEDLLFANSLIHYGSPWRTQSTGPLVRSVLFSTVAEREIVPDANEKSSYIDLSYDTKLKSMTVSDTTKTSELSSAEPTTRLRQREMGSYFVRCW